MKKCFYPLFLLLSFLYYSQTDLLSELDTLQTEELEQPIFKGLQVVTAQSTKLASKKEFYFVVAHRFGDVSRGFDNFFGLDNATTKLGGIYGVTDGISVSFARHTYNKTYEIGIKYKLLKQNKSKNIPIEMVGYHVLDINSELKKSNYPKIKLNDRFSYLSQLLISRRFSEKLSLQISPSFVHKNLISPEIDLENYFLTGIGGRYKISKRISINAEYFHHFNKKNFYENPLSLGMDLETGGHVFQLIFSNSQPTTDVAYLTNATGDWSKGKVYFGFNLYRVF